MTIMTVRMMMMKVTTMPARIPTNGVNCRGTGDSENRNAGNIVAKNVPKKNANDANIVRIDNYKIKCNKMILSNKRSIVDVEKVYDDLINQHLKNVKLNWKYIRRMAKKLKTLLKGYFNITIIFLTLADAFLFFTN